MLLSGSPALLLACVMSILFWPLQQATTIIYRGCAYRAVVGKEQALWFCLADNLCAMFHCQDNNVFSLDDCGCVPPHPARPKASLHSGKNGSGTGAGVSMTTAASSTSTSSLLISSSSLESVVLSGGGSIATSPLPPTFPSSSSKHAADCRPEIHIDGLTATRMGATGPGGGGGGPHSVHIEPRGVIDLGNGSAFYDGYSYLAVPLYADADFGAGISVEFVLQEGTSTLRQVLMTNCKHGQGASVEVVMDVELGVIVFHLIYRFRDAVNAVESVAEVAVPYTQSQSCSSTQACSVGAISRKNVDHASVSKMKFCVDNVGDIFAAIGQPFIAKRVSLVFDGQRLTGRVNNNQRSASVQGNGDYVMARRAKPLMFGNTLCDVDDVYSFRGQIKQISVYRCAKNLTSLS